VHRFSESACVTNGAAKVADCMIFSLSRGLTTVLDAAPATPPAMKYAETSGLKKTKTLRFTDSSDCSASCSGSACGIGSCDDVMVLVVSSKQALKLDIAGYYEEYSGRGLDQRNNVAGETDGTKVIFLVAVRLPHPNPANHAVVFRCLT